MIHCSVKPSGGIVTPAADRSFAAMMSAIDPADRRRAVLALSSRGADLADRLLAAEEGSDVGTTSAGLADVTGRA